MKNLIHTSVLSPRFLGRNHSSKPFLGRLIPFILWVLFFTNISVQAQQPTLAWQKLLGGEGIEEGRITLQTSDGGYIMAGNTASSNTGDVGTNHENGSIDCWVVKMNALGVIQWQKLLGGSGNELVTMMQQTADGGYIISAYTNSSNTGDIGTNHGGAYDYWIIKLDALGNITWQKLLGGNGEDRASSVKQTTDGGYIVEGYSYSSNSGDVAGTNHGDADIWVVKLDALGNITWQKLLGGYAEELSYDIQQTTDGGYIVSGQTLSFDSGNVGLNHGRSDSWIVKLDAVGNIQWQKTLGGDDIEGSPFIQQTADGYLLSINTFSSNTGDVGSNHGSVDAWFVKLDIVGNIVWQKTIGGSGDDIVYSFQKIADGGYLMVGYTSSSNSGDIGQTKGGFDGWILKFNTLGVIEWQKTWGGSNDDYFYTLQQTTDGGFTVTGYTESSNSGDIGASHGAADAWIIRLYAPCTFAPSVTGGNSVSGGETITLTGSATTGTAVWSSDNTNIATVSQTGVVTGIGGGTTTISYAVTEDSCTAIVSKSVTVVAFAPTKCYRIVNKVSGKVLEVKDASIADSAQIYQGSITGNPNQLWNFTKLADGKYSIASVGSGKVMDILDNGPAGFCAEGTIIQQFPFDGTNSQRWRIEVQPDLSFKIYNGTCNKPLRLESGSLLDGANVGIKADFGTESFKWYIQEAPCAAPIDPNQCYRIVNKATNKVLEVKDGLDADGTQIYQWASSNTRQQQIWHIREFRAGTAKFNIISSQSVKLMDILDNTAAGYCVEGTIIQQFTADKTNSQNWLLEPQTDGSYKILNATCNKYLRVESASTADGASVGIKNDFGSDAFKWHFQATNCTAAALSATNTTFGFEARAAEGRTKLQWITNTGYKNDYFEVERLNANGNFDILGRQNAYAGDDMKSYTFTDNDPLDGDNFYRINSISQNGLPQYSEVKKVSFSKNDGINIFPNPADEFINVDLRKYEGKTVSLSVYNSVGLLVKKQTIEKVSAAPQQIDIQGFGTGSYLLRVQSEGKREVTRLFHIAK